MVYRKELLLVRIQEIMVDVQTDLGGSADNVFRNRGEIPPPMRPGMTLLDGNERTILGGNATKRMGRVRPSVMALEPQIWTLLAPRPLSAADELGPELSSYVVAFLKAIPDDPSILALISENGQVIYQGHETDMQSGSSMEGQLLMKFAFHYLLDPSEL